MAEPLTLRKAVDIFGLDCDTSKRSAYIVCPVCGKSPSEKKMNLSFDKYGYDDGVYRCNKCGESGKALHFWALLRNLSTFDMTAVAKDYYSYAGRNPSAIKTEKKHIARIDVDIADIHVRDATYNALLNILGLNETHKRSLLKRGLSEQVIEHNKYRSYPVASVQHICELLLSEGLILEGVPGFYQLEDGRWTMLRASGFLIPQRNGFGQIQGMQLRLDRNRDPRYLTLSTGDRYYKGAKGRGYCHFAKGREQKNVILTEGALKADIISYYTGQSVLALQGVNSTAYLKKALYDLKQKGTRKIMIAFDMDLYENIHVKQALEKLVGIIESTDLPYSLLTWDRKQKGLDDYYHDKAKHK